MKDFIGILQALPHGPFTVPITQLKQHPAQRPLDPVAVNKLIPSLAGSDQRLVYDATLGYPMIPLTVVPDALWESHPSPPNLPASLTMQLISPLPLDNISPEYPLAFSHGHRAAALDSGLQSEFKEAIEDIYGQNLTWPNYILPSCECYQIISCLPFAHTFIQSCWALFPSTSGSTTSLSSIGLMTFKRVSQSLRLTPLGFSTSTTSTTTST